MKGNSVIVGLGQTGWSCVRYLHNQGLSFFVVDTRLEPPYLSLLKKHYPDIRFFLGREIDAEKILHDISQCIVSPGLSLNEPFLQAAQSRKLRIIGDVELFASACDKPIIAITGSNGKSTVTTLVTELLKTTHLSVGMGGNIGTPVLDLLDHEPPFDVYVLELSSFQLDTTYSLAPSVATILNISPDHLDRYADYADYVASKQKILTHAQTIVRLDQVDQFRIDQQAIYFKHEKLIDLSHLKLMGAHNHSNVLVALRLVYALLNRLNMTFESYQQAFMTVLTNFKGLAHRCEWVLEYQGVQWINDSKGTNIGASLAAIQSLAQTLLPKAQMILIIGGDGKKQDFTLFASALNPLKALIRAIIFIGKDGLGIQSCVDSISLIPSVYTQTLHQAIDWAFKAAQPHDKVLLSPACSSLDQYSSYVARGEDFVGHLNSRIMT